MANGAKLDETRNGLTKIRGEVAICAALKWTGELKRLACSDPFHEALTGKPFSLAGSSDIIAATPLGCVVAVGELYDSWTSERWMEHYFPEGFGDIHHMERERKFGNYAPGRGVWRFCNMRKLKVPVPVRGAQQWFNLPPAVEEAVRAQL